MEHDNHSASQTLPDHVAIIMDGNGRWAQCRGEARSAGHRAGAEVAKNIIETAAHVGISTLTLYAFSSDNWKRPRGEVATLMSLAETFFRREAAHCRENGIRLSVIGKRERLPLAVRAAVAAAERLTQGGNRLHVRVALDYSSRAAILEAAVELVSSSRPGRTAPFRRSDREPDASMLEDFSRLISRVDGEGPSGYDVDLLIRTGGEKRLSDFLLWEAAYAELFFTQTLWPDFGPRDFHLALADYADRERRFGSVISPGGERTA